MILLVVAFASVAAVCAQAADKQLPQVSVCEVIAKRNVYNGRTVAVRGEVKGGGHGAWLAPPSECDHKVVTRGVEWPSVVYLAYPSNESPNVTDHAKFQVDWSTIREAEAAVKRQRFNPDTDRIIKTYIGRFVTYPDLENRVSPGVPGALRLGFGPAGLEAPAQLLIKSVKDVVVLPGTAR